MKIKLVSILITLFAINPILSSQKELTILAVTALELAAHGNSFQPRKQAKSNLGHYFKKTKQKEEKNKKRKNKFTKDKQKYPCYSN